MLLSTMILIMSKTTTASNNNNTNRSAAVDIGVCETSHLSYLLVVAGTASHSRQARRPSWDHYCVKLPVPPVLLSGVLGLAIIHLSRFTGMLRT